MTGLHPALAALTSPPTAACATLSLITAFCLVFFFLKRTDIFTGYFLPSEIPEDFPLARITGALYMLWTDARAPGAESLYCP